MELENALAYERSNNSSSGVELKELRIRVEDLRRKIAELESSNQNLGHKASELQINLQEQGAAYQSQVLNMGSPFYYLLWRFFALLGWGWGISRGFDLGKS